MATSLALLLSSLAYPQGPSERILYSKPYGGGIWSMNTDGSDPVELSSFGWYGAYNNGATRIAFGEYYHNGIWVMDADGSNPVKIADEGSDPSWSPDGSQLVFSTGTTYLFDHRVWIMDADGGNRRLLTERYGDHPNWSHHGSKIVFCSQGDGIYTIDADGGSEQRIHAGGFAPAWAPDDSKIVFAAGEIYQMDPDGSNVEQVSVSWGNNPTMAPDLQTVAFMNQSNGITTVKNMVETVIQSNAEAPNWSILDAGPPYDPGLVFSGVGLIPATEIDSEGYATTEPGYMFHVEDAPFGGALQIFGNFDEHRAYNVAEYAVEAARWPTRETAPAEGDFLSLLDSWGNYIWDPAQHKYVYRVIAPDADGHYQVPAAGEEWYLDDLMIQWNTREFEAGKYTVRLRAFRPDGSELTIPESLNALILTIDNSRPVVSIDEVRYAGAPVDACAIISLAANDPLEFECTAFSAAGHLLSYTLSANYGENQSFTIASDYYVPNPLNQWTGISGELFSYASWPETCAYDFRLHAWSRTIDGYKRLYHASYDKHMTLMLP